MTLGVHEIRRRSGGLQRVFIFAFHWLRLQRAYQIVCIEAKQVHDFCRVLTEFGDAKFGCVDGQRMGAELILNTVAGAEWRSIFGELGCVFENGCGRGV